MPYKLNKNQDHLEKGFTRFNFYFKYKGIQNRKTVVCRKSAVETIYRDWQNEIFTADNPQLKYSLFEILDEYQKDIDANRSGQMLGYTHTIISYFKLCFDNIDLSSFGRINVKDYITWRRGQSKQRGGKPICDRSINREIAELSKFFTWCIEREIYQKVNPCFKQKLKVNIQREVYLTSNQLEELLNAANEEGELIFTAVLIALSTGFRRGEVFNLEWKDIDFKHSRIYLRASTTKNKKGRIVTVPDYLIEHLQRKMEKAFDKQGSVFKEWESMEWLRNSFERVRKKLSFNPLPNGSNLHFHDLRHVYAQSLRDMGVALQDIQAFLGHSSVSVTEKFYAQAGGKDAKEKVERLAEIIPINQFKAS